MKAYIAGPMQGKPEFNFPAFFEAEEKLIDLGFEVVNPARIDEEQGAVAGTDFTTNSVTVEAHTQYMRRDIPLVMGCDVLVLLDDWFDSAGANIELTIARAVGMPVLYMGARDRRPRLSMALPIGTVLNAALQDRALKTMPTQDLREVVRVL